MCCRMWGGVTRCDVGPWPHGLWCLEKLEKRRKWVLPWSLLEETALQPLVSVPQGPVGLLIPRAVRKKMCCLSH